MSWCDKLGSTPAFGFTFEPHFASSSRLLDTATEITDAMVENGQKVQFSIDRQEQFLVVFTSFSGFSYTLDQSKASVLFQHRVRVQRESGAPPSMHMVSVAKPYTQLLEEVAERAVQIARLLPRIEKRKVERVGVMTITVVEEEELPPGIANLMKYQAGAWKGKVSNFNSQFTYIIDESEKIRDRCICTIAKAEDQDDKLITIQLDWQRSFLDRRLTNQRSLTEIAKDAKVAALQVFEGLGDGGGYDEKVYS